MNAEKPTNLIHTLVAHPFVYDLVQKVLGAEKSRKRLRQHLATVDMDTVLDIGGGTGAVADLLPPSATYLWTDIDSQKCAGLRAKHPDVWAVFNDATCLGLRDKSVDYAVCIAVAHHLDDSKLPLLFSEVKRVTRKKFIFFDPIAYNSILSRTLWAYDRGSYPRSKEALMAALEAYFEIEHVESYSIYHHYVLCVAKP